MSMCREASWMKARPATIRTLNEFQSLEEIASIAIVRVESISGSAMSLPWSGAMRSASITRVNGVESIEVEIYKEADANIVDVARLYLSDARSTICSGSRNR